MFTMAVGHSDDVDVDMALAAVFDECDESLKGERPSAGLLFCAWETDHRAIVDAIRSRYPGIELAGSTSNGEMSSVLGFQEDSVVLALFASDAVDITAGLGINAGSAPRSAAWQAVEQARAKTDREPRLCIAMPAVSADPASVLGHLREALGPGIPILGGGAVPKERRESTATSYQFVGEVVTHDAVAILLMSGSLSYSFGVAAGWRPVGPRGTVTRASGQAVRVIDDRPALDFYERYLGSGDPPIAIPLAVYEERSDTFYLRAPMGFDRETGTVTFAGGVPEGATVQLTVATTDEIFQGTKSALSKALEGFPQGIHPDAGLVFSCGIRKLLLGTRTGKEIDMTRELFGADLPVAGFYCFGEIAPMASPDLSRFHNETIVAVLLGSG